MPPIARLIIVCGLPGSGKTTLARQLERDRPGLRLCPDEWMEALGISIWDTAARGRTEALQWELAQQLLAQPAASQTVIIEWGTWARSERDTLRLRARELGAAVELHYLTAPPEVLFDRIQRRAREDPPITADQVHSWATTFQPPTQDELALYDPPP